MRNTLVALSCVIMVAYVLYRGFTTVVFLPFVTSFDSWIGILSILLILLAAGAIVLTIVGRNGMAALLSTSVGAVALGSWLFIIFTSSVWTRTYFIWSVLPEVCFSLAGILNWRFKTFGELDRSEDSNSDI
jgi:hypothetical protein